MILLDVNVVLAAHREDHPNHAAVRPWFDELVAGRERFTVPRSVWASVVRLATHPRVFVVPSPISEVFGFARAVTDSPNHVDLAAGDQQLALFEQACVDADATGDLVSDAYLASLAIEHGCALASLDRDFLRFEHLRLVRPGDHA